MEQETISHDSNRKVLVEIWGVRFSALATVFMGLLNLISAIRPALENRIAILDQFIPLAVRHGGRITSVLAGFALLLLAGNLWRRKRTAWLVTIILLSVTFFSHLLKGLDFEEASLTLAVLLLLLFLRNSYQASTDKPSLKQGLTVLAVALAFTLLYGTIGFFLLDRHFSVKFGLVDALQQTLVMFTAFYNPGLEPITGYGKYFADSIYVIGFATLGYSIIMLVRPVLVRGFATPEEHQRAEEIIERHGRTALCRAALFDDKSYFFSSDDSVIAYAAYGRGAIVLGDPICPPDSARKSIIDFREFCERNDWMPAFISTLPDYLAEYRNANFDTICLGYEAIVDLKKFTLEGSDNKDLRYIENRMKRLGFQAVVHEPPFDKPFMDSLKRISDSWLTLHHGGEMHFSDGWFTEPYLQSGAVMVIHDPAGNPTAFANLVGEYQKNELTIDLMRHLPKVESGTMEFLFTSLLLHAQEKGADSFSLGLSAIVGVGEKPEDPQVEKLLHTIAEYLSRFFNFKGLHKFKDKFHPDWQPRYLVYQGAASLPVIMNTLLEAHSGQNYVWKFIRKQA